ncbi:MAG: hypothetical protein R3F34_05025 [Planctomycetota bacterium]
MRFNSIARASLLSVAVSSVAYAQTANEDAFVESPILIGGALEGFAVDVDGDRMIVGAIGDNTFGALAGAAHIYEKSGATWSEVANLAPANLVANDLFGSSVAIDGDRVIVGAYLDQSTVQNGGSASVFERQANGTWLEAGVLVNSDNVFNDQFGRSVDIDGDRALVGCWGRDDKGNASGGAYVFERQAGVWNQVAKITAMDGQALDQFGIAVDLQGDRCAIGANFEDDKGADAGAAYIFERQANGTWRQMTKLTASDGIPGDEFGYALSLDGDRVVVGCRGHDTGAAPFNTGRVYVYERASQASWPEVTFIAPSDVSQKEFGAEVELKGDRMIVGAWVDALGGVQRGSAYWFQRQPNNSWMEMAKITASDGLDSDRFGISIGLSGDRIAIGSYQKDGAGGLAADSGGTYVVDIGTLLHGDPTISASAGGTHDFILRSPTTPGQLFLFLGSLSGTSPGLFDPVSAKIVPLNFDAYMSLLLNTSGAGLLQPWFGFLDGNGFGNAAFVVPAGINASFVGKTFYHGFITIDLFGTGILSLASNPVAATIVP